MQQRLAEVLDISSAFVGLVIVSVGTSLPELATALAAARRNETDLVLGNVVGSNIANPLTMAFLVWLVPDSREIAGDQRIARKGRLRHKQQQDQDQEQQPEEEGDQQPTPTPSQSQGVAPTPTPNPNQPLFAALERAEAEAREQLKSPTPRAGKVEKDW